MNIVISPDKSVVIIGSLYAQNNYLCDMTTSVAAVVEIAFNQSFAAIERNASGLEFNMSRRFSRALPPPR